LYFGNRVAVLKDFIYQIGGSTCSLSDLLAINQLIFGKSINHRLGPTSPYSSTPPITFPTSPPPPLIFLLREARAQGEDRWSRSAGVSARRGHRRQWVSPSHTSSLSLSLISPSFFSNSDGYGTKGPTEGWRVGQAVGMVAGRLRVLAVVEVVGPGRGGGLSPDLAQMAAGEVAGVGEDSNGGRRREGGPRHRSCSETLPRQDGGRWQVIEGGGARLNGLALGHG
jgi:hypothetical protein